jgi:hypothetical protein
MLGSKAHLSQCTTTAIDIAGDSIKRESQVRYLGAFIDET